MTARWTWAAVGMVVVAGLATLVASAGARTTRAQGESPWETLAFCTQRVSVGPGGVESDGVSQEPTLSDDGRLVAFASLGTNLAAGDVNDNWDIFVHDRGRHETVRVSFSPNRTEDGGLGAGDAFLSGDGRVVSYVARAARAAPSAPYVCTVAGLIRSVECMVVLDISAGTLAVADVRPDGQPGSGFSRWGALTRDGALAAFWSHGADLLPEDGDSISDVFARDLAGATTHLVSVSSGGTKGDAASGDVVVLGGDAVSVSRDGRYVSFASRAYDLAPLDHDGVDLFLRDRATGTTELVSRAAERGRLPDGESVSAARQAISDDGRYVAFASMATNLVGASGSAPGRYQVYVRDRQSGTAELASAARLGGPGSGHSVTAAVSADGRYVAFGSAASDLVAGDSNGSIDVFVRDRAAGRTYRASVATDGTQANGPSALRPYEGVSVSADGLTLAFYSDASNLVDGDRNGVGDVFVRYPCGKLPTPTITPAATVTASATATAPPPFATATPTATAPPNTPPVPVRCVCRDVVRHVPPAVLADAMANPQSYYGWRYPLDPGKPPGPNNPPRECLTLKNRGLPFHPLWNRPEFRVGCP